MPQPLAVEAFQNEGIDRIARPALLTHFRKRPFFGWNEGPVPFPLRALFDPAVDQINLAIRQLLATHVSRWHADSGVVRYDPLIQVAVGGIAGHDRHPALAQLDLRAAFDIETQL